MSAKLHFCVSSWLWEMPPLCQLRFLNQLFHQKTNHHVSGCHHGLHVAETHVGSLIRNKDSIPSSAEGFVLVLSRLWSLKNQEPHEVPYHMIEACDWPDSSSRGAGAEECFFDSQCPWMCDRWLKTPLSGGLSKSPSYAQCTSQWWFGKWFWCQPKINFNGTPPRNLAWKLKLCDFQKLYSSSRNPFSIFRLPSWFCRVWCGGASSYVLGGAMATWPHIKDGNPAAAIETGQVRRCKRTNSVQPLLPPKWWVNRLPVKSPIQWN